MTYVLKNCPKCGGDHWGSYTCPFSDADIARMMNDEAGYWEETPEERWKRMRSWVDGKIRKEAQQ